jgi:hypothetical protein
MTTIAPLLVLLLAAPPEGQGRIAPTPEVRARKAFDRAELLYRQARFQEALEAYSEALGHQRHPAFLFNIGQCHRQLGDHPKALFFFKLFLSEQPDAPNRAEVETRIRELELKVAEQAREAARQGKLSVSSSPAGAEVFIDSVSGPPVARTPAVIQVKPGQRLVVLRKAGFRDVQRTVDVPAGRIALVAEDLVPLRAEPTPVAPAGPTPLPVHRRWWFATGLALSGAALGVAVYTGTTALAMKRQWDREGGPPADDPGFADRQRAYRISTDVLLGLGAAGVLATAVSAAILGKRRAERAGVTLVSPSCGPSGCGLSVGGRW